MYVFDRFVNLYSHVKTFNLVTPVLVPANGKYTILVNDSALMYMPIAVLPKQINYSHKAAK